MRPFHSGLIYAALTATLAFAPAASQAQETSPILSGRDLAHPVISANGMVASQEALATKAGLEILKKGGNAVDAAAAVGFALAVTLPRAGNLGGGGFMLVHRADRNETVAIDYREKAPAAAFKDMFLNDSGEADSEKSRFSGLAVGVPGTVAGLVMAQRDYGSGKLSLAEVMAPAIRLAEDGFDMPANLAISLERVRMRLSRDAEAYVTFYGEAGLPIEPGARFKQPDLAATLHKIAREGANGFYRGAVAEAIAGTVKAQGGDMTPEDLALYRAVIREPVRGTYRGYEVASMPPPSSGGIHIVQILNILEGFDLSKTGPNSAATINLMAEAMKHAYADRSKYLGDPDFVEVPVKGLTAKAYAKELRAQIVPGKVTPSTDIAPANPLPYESNQTTHFSVVDSQGNAVSNTYTLNFSYGAGFMAKGTGVLLNNELDDFSAKPGVPNAYGLIGGEANAVAPRKRPLSSMSPTIVFKEGKPWLVTGSPGGSRIITTVLQMVLNVIDHGMNIAEASAAPRVHHQWLPDELRVEEGLSPDTLKLLSDMGYEIAVKNAMGSTQSIMAVDGVLMGASDPRTEGDLTQGY
ncbi:gamma-glutamyltranspeptidase/glutathione hydrolase [Breoghania corrubedonensis]|uniref:Glutathione hydrolase proenzyme n=1 Tax=Breoghania corrubedonensis TaxID=665038 RepID=A0A2T5VHV3_9HYPH|nr:gamma-glutamyltransferase [Breoghania corrubedonensis]PTW63335.1 gamma-glutamyltranspeptidase/glutathione hydrolase [Breoghania corrubedonensis]